MNRERRRNVRVPFESTIQLKAGHLLVSCRGVNVSRDGLLVYAPVRLPRNGGAVDVIASLPGQGRALELHGELIRQVCEASCYAVGIRLVDTPTTSATLLQAHVLDALERNVPANDPAREPSSPELRKQRLERIQHKSGSRERKQKDQPTERWRIGS